uniref:mitogen-activated protein kinase kinase kinase n=1 Tax=Oryza meridionalis TaxID=40149 RepID=A0A0E0DCN2_9ORYZ
MAAQVQLAMPVAAVPHLPAEETTPSVDVEIASPDQQQPAAAAAPSMAVFPPAADDDDEEEAVAVLLSGEFFTCWSSLSESTDDETTRRTTTESMFYIPMNGNNDVGRRRRRRKVRSWSRGSFLGRGSFGMVFEGITNEGVFFAVKEVYLDDQGRYDDAQQCIFQLQQEIALLSRLQHNNIVQYYGTDKEDSKLYVFLELMSQGSLASLYQKYRLRNSHVSRYTKQILNGLIYLHDRNIVHRDVKCGNTLVHRNGSVKLADFGIAKEINKFSVLKSCEGSVYWMAPEVVNPKRTYGTAADIWSLGCTVLEMLTRQLPYPNLEWAQALFKIGRGEPPAIPKYLSKEARDFISQCLRPNPDDRPSASKLLDHPFVNRSVRSIMSVMTS